MNRRVSAKFVFWVIAGIFGVCLLVKYPPFYLVALEEEKEKLQANAFHADLFACQVWENDLAGSLDKAFDARDVLKAILHDPQNARNRYARVVGLGGPHHYLLEGTGKIIAINNRQIELSINETDVDPEIILLTSMIFGNEVLDTTNIVSRSQFQRTNDYNAVSAEVNKIVEARIVQPFLKHAKIGTTVYFIGCSTKIMDDGPLPIPMRLVPVKLEVE